MSLSYVESNLFLTILSSQKTAPLETEIISKSQTANKHLVSFHMSFIS